MKKQTAVDWLVNVVQSCIAPNFIPKEIVKQAKAMEREQIKDAWVCGNNNFDEHGIGSDRYAISDEHFYNETYKQP